MEQPDLLTPQAREALASGIPADELFTPIVDGKRMVMRVEPGSLRVVSRRLLGRRGEITDELTGKRYLVLGVPCSQPGCYCDAEAYLI